MIRRVPLLAVAAFASTIAAVSPAARAQGEARMEWQKRADWFSFGVPRVGKHSIDELQAGSTWRMGANGITTLTVETPLIAGDFGVAPGVYRTNIARQTKDQLELTIEGAGTRLAAGGDNVSVPLKLEILPKPNDKLEIELAPAKEQPDPELRAFTFRLQFGAPCVTAPISIVGSAPVKAKGFGGAAFKLPAKWLDERLKLAKHTPILTLERSGKVPDGVPEQMNLLLSENDVIFLPTMKAPTENRGFGAIPQPDPSWILKGTVTWTPSQKPADHLRVDTIEVDKDVLHVVAAIGERIADIKVGTAPSKDKDKGAPGATTPSKN